MSEAPQPVVRGVRGRAEAWLRPAVVALVLVAAALAWAWWSTRAELAAVREEVAERLRDAANESKEARVVAREAQEAVRDAQAKIGALEAKHLESQSQQLGLESLFQELSRSRDDWVLAEVEQTFAPRSRRFRPPTPGSHAPTGRSSSACAR
jgi:uncharacterized protein HemX